MRKSGSKSRRRTAVLLHSYLTWQHRWTGLLMTVFLVVVGITGSLLAYRTDIDRLINPQFFAKRGPGSKRLTMGEIAARAEQIEPRIQVWYLYDQVPDSVSILCVPRKDPKTGKSYAIDFDHIILDPYSGRELGRRSEFDIKS